MKPIINLNKFPMRKIILLLTIGILAIVGVSCKKEVEVNYENLEGRWDSETTDMVFDFNTESKLIVTYESTREIISMPYEILDDEKKQANNSFSVACNLTEIKHIK